MYKSLFLIFCLTSVAQSYAQNTSSDYTRPVTSRLAKIFPHNNFIYENNLMNHISDQLRLESNEVGKEISCNGGRDGILMHSNSKGLGTRNLEIRCHNDETLKYAQKIVGQQYSTDIGKNLKYAFKSGPYIFAVCNYDDNEHADHSHYEGHYVCRVPQDKQSTEGDIETFCFEMSFFHKTCNPHKALVSTEIITINSTSRWSSIDKTILMRFLNNSPTSKEISNRLIQEIASSRVYYNSKRRGSPDADQRYPKLFLGSDYACIEERDFSDSKYIDTEIECGSLSHLRWFEKNNITHEDIKEHLVFKQKMRRLKQVSSSYPMLDGMSSSID